ncbi:type II toxin-antitoxin system RelE/ParE family toxin [bacterium]|nr:type II toxin-antitoxin system RelE/ParE family toxin [bacterium]
MTYKIRYKSSVSHDLKKISKTMVSKIIDKLETSLAQNPYAGKLLTGEFKGLYRLRVGDYRIIYSIFDDSVLILRIAHRKKAYR